MSKLSKPTRWSGILKVNARCDWGSVGVIDLCSPWPSGLVFWIVLLMHQTACLGACLPHLDPACRSDRRSKSRWWQFFFLSTFYLSYHPTQTCLTNIPFVLSCFPHLASYFFTTFNLSLALRMHYDISYPVPLLTVNPSYFLTLPANIAPRWVTYSLYIYGG